MSRPPDQPSIGRQFLAQFAHEWLDVRTFFAKRRALLDNPKDVLANQSKGVVAYALFFTSAPYVIAMVVLSLLVLTKVVPPSPLERTIAEWHENVRDVDRLAGEGEARCSRLEKISSLAMQRCITYSGKTSESLRIQAEDILWRLESTRHIQEYFKEYIALISAIGVMLNAYTFTYLWNKFYPHHVRATAEDKDRALRVYLFTVSTSMFIPACIGAAIILVTDLISRYSPITSAYVNSSIIGFGTVPFVAGTVLSCHRINMFLKSDYSWRIGGTFILLWASSIITNIPLWALFVVAMAIL